MALHGHAHHDAREGAAPVSVDHPVVGAPGARAAGPQDVEAELRRSELALLEERREAEKLRAQSCHALLVVEQLEAQLREGREELQEARQEAADLGERVRRLQDEAAHLGRTIAAQGEQLGSVEEELEGKTRELAAARRDMAALRHDLALAREEAAEAAQPAPAHRERDHSLHGLPGHHAEAKMAELRRETERLQDACMQASEEASCKQRAIGELQMALAATEQELHEAQLRNDSLEHELATQADFLRCQTEQRAAERRELEQLRAACKNGGGVDLPRWGDNLGGEIYDNALAQAMPAGAVVANIAQACKQVVQEECTRPLSDLRREVALLRAQQGTGSSTVVEQTRGPRDQHEPLLSQKPHEHSQAMVHLSHEELFGLLAELREEVGASGDIVEIAQVCKQVVHDECSNPLLALRHEVALLRDVHGESTVDGEQLSALREDIQELTTAQGEALAAHGELTALLTELREEVGRPNDVVEIAQVCKQVVQEECANPLSALRHEVALLRDLGGGSMQDVEQMRALREALERLADQQLEPGSRAEAVAEHQEVVALLKELREAGTSGDLVEIAQVCKQVVQEECGNPLSALRHEVALLRDLHSGSTDGEQILALREDLQKLGVAQAASARSELAALLAELREDFASGFAGLALQAEGRPSDALVDNFAQACKQVLQEECSNHLSALRKEVALLKELHSGSEEKHKEHALALREALQQVTHHQKELAQAAGVAPGRGELVSLLSELREDIACGLAALAVQAESKPRGAGVDEVAQACKQAVQEEVAGPLSAVQREAAGAAFTQRELIALLSEMREAKRKPQEASVDELAQACKQAVQEECAGPLSAVQREAAGTASAQRELVALLAELREVCATMAPGPPAEAPAQPQAETAPPTAAVDHLVQACKHAVQEECSHPLMDLRLEVALLRDLHGGSQGEREQTQALRTELRQLIDQRHQERHEAAGAASAHGQLAALLSELREELERHRADGESLRQHLATLHANPRPRAEDGEDDVKEWDGVLSSLARRADAGGAEAARAPADADADAERDALRGLLGAACAARDAALDECARLAAEQEAGSRRSREEGELEARLARRERELAAARIELAKAKKECQRLVKKMSDAEQQRVKNRSPPVLVYDAEGVGRVARRIVQIRVGHGTGDLEDSVEALATGGADVSLSRLRAGQVGTYDWDAPWQDVRGLPPPSDSLGGPLLMAPFQLSEDGERWEWRYQPPAGAWQLKRTWRLDGVLAFELEKEEEASVPRSSTARPQERAQALPASAKLMAALEGEQEAPPAALQAGTAGARGRSGHAGQRQSTQARPRGGAPARRGVRASASVPPPGALSAPAEPLGPVAGALAGAPGSTLSSRASQRKPPSPSGATSFPWMGSAGFPAIGDRVVVSEKITGAGPQAGTVRFVGLTQFATGQWVGVALDSAVGRNSGVVEGTQYFDCPPKHGLFVRPSMVIPALPVDPPALLDALRGFLEARSLRVVDLFRSPAYNLGYTGASKGEERLDAQELSQLLRLAGFGISPADCSELIASLDGDGDGKLGISDLDGALRERRRGKRAWPSSAQAPPATLESEVAPPALGKSMAPAGKAVAPPQQVSPPLSGAGAPDRLGQAPGGQASVHRAGRVEWIDRRAGAS